MTYDLAKALAPDIRVNAIAPGWAASMLQELAASPDPQVMFGQTEWKQAVSLPLERLVKAHSIITGGTGSGKTMAALILVSALIEANVASILAEAPTPLGFGVLDAKGELFERVLYLLSQRLQTLPKPVAEQVKQRVVVIDLSSPDPISSYNIARPWADSDLDFFTHNRVETLQEVLPSNEGLSVRGNSVLKHTLGLLAKCQIPFGYIDQVLAKDELRAQLLAHAQDDELTEYFEQHFARESKATIGAVRSRLVASLLSTESLRLALSGQALPDLRALQDEGKIILIKCGGANIPRSAARTFQSLFLSDVRQAIFARLKPEVPFLWLCDEAHAYFRTQQLRDNMTDILMMSRSFGSFCCFITQNISTAVRDPEMREILHTNIRWSLSLRGTANDAQFLLSGLPVSGRLAKPRSNPYAPAEFYTPKEERVALLDAMAHLPDRSGWLWLKAWTGEAIKLKTATLNIPTGEAFNAAVERLRADPGFGNRMGRETYLKAMAERDAVWQAKKKKEEPSNQFEKLKRTFQAQKKGKM